MKVVVFLYKSGCKLFLMLMWVGYINDPIEIRASFINYVYCSTIKNY